MSGFTQRHLILWHLQAGNTITQLEALSSQFGGCMRLSDVIYKIRRAGFAVGKEMVSKKGVNGVKTFARYKLRGAK